MFDTPMCRVCSAWCVLRGAWVCVVVEEEEQVYVCKCVCVRVCVRACVYECVQCVCARGGEKGLASSPASSSTAT